MKADLLVAYKFIGYCDESEDVSYLCLASVVAAAHHWAPFEDAWQTLVSEYGMPEFHMQELEHRKGFWENWDNPADRRAVEQRFLDLFCNPYWPVSAFLVGVDLAAFAETVGPKIKAIHPGKGYDKPWLFAFVHLLDRMTMMQRHTNLMFGTDERLGLFFDEKDKVAGRVADIVQTIRQDVPFPQIGAVAFDDSRNQPAIQAADLLAYEARRALSEIILPEEPTKDIRDPWWQLMHAKSSRGRQQVWAENWNAAALQRNVDAVSEAPEPSAIAIVEDDAAVRWLTGRGYEPPSQ